MKKLFILLILLFSLISCNRLERAKVENIQLIDSIFVKSSQITTIYDASNIQTIPIPSHYDYRFGVTLSKDGTVRKDTIKTSTKNLNINIGDSIYIKRR